MKRVRDDLHVASHALISNIWLFEDHRKRRYLIDTGHPLERPQITRQLRRHGIAGPGDLAGILLTHRHSDHAGNAGHFRERFRCPVVCHPEDAPFLTGQTPPPKMATADRPWFARPLCHIEDRWPARAVLWTWPRSGRQRGGAAEAADAVAVCIPRSSGQTALHEDLDHHPDRPAPHRMRRQRRLWR